MLVSRFTCAILFVSCSSSCWRVLDPRDLNHAGPRSALLLLLLFDSWEVEIRRSGARFPNDCRRCFDDQIAVASTPTAMSAVQKKSTRILYLSRTFLIESN